MSLTIFIPERRSTVPGPRLPDSRHAAQHGPVARRCPAGRESPGIREGLPGDSRSAAAQRVTLSSRNGLPRLDNRSARPPTPGTGANRQTPSRYSTTTGCTAAPRPPPTSDLNSPAGGFPVRPPVLGNQRSLHEPIPDDLTELLETTLGLFAAHHDQAVYQRLADQAAAFDQHGNPAVELIGNPPSRLVAFASRTMTGIPKLALAITSIAAITAIIIAVALALLHRMNITDLLSYLR